MGKSQPFESRIIKAIKNIDPKDYPLIIELSGLPKLGKTLFADALLDLFLKSGCKVELTSEVSFGYPIADRWSVEFSSWKISSFIKEFLDSKITRTQVLITDRGLFDAIVWLRLKLDRNICDQETFDNLRRMSRTKLWFEHFCVVLAFTGSIPSILDRSQNTRLYSGESEVTTVENLTVYQKAMENEASLWNQKSDLVNIFDTENLSIKEMLNKGAESVISSIEQFQSR